MFTRRRYGLRWSSERKGHALRAPCKGVVLQWVQIPPGTWVASAGSYRSGGGGNETAGAFETAGRFGDSASRQAVTRVNVEQASKSPMWSPTLRNDGEGRRCWVQGNGWNRPSHERSKPSGPPGY